VAESGVYQHKDISAVEYDALAPIYDRLMSHVEYEAWQRLIEKVVDKFHGRQRNVSVFELGGGTGMLGKLLTQSDWQYLGSDRCPGMCKKAADRGVPFVCANARALPLKKKFDLFLFLYDGINYLATPEEYAALFEQVYHSLEPGGLFLFDITTEANSLNHFKWYLDFEDWDDYAFVRRSYYNRQRQEQHNDFTIFKRVSNDPTRYERFIETHCQKVLSVNEISRAVQTRLFSIEGIWDGFSFRRYSPHSERIHFLLKKRDS